MFFVKSLHYGSKISSEASKVINTLRDTEKLDKQAESYLQEMERQIELIEEVDSSYENDEDESQNSMKKILAERRQEWRTLIAKVDTMVNQYNELPSLLETFDRKYDEVLKWIQSVESCQQHLQRQENMESLITVKEELNVSSIFLWPIRHYKLCYFINIYK